MKLGAGALVAAALVVSGCGSHEAKEAKGIVSLPTVNVEVATVERVALPLKIEVSGMVRSKDRASIAPKVMGTIETFSVAMGEKVKKGQLLARINAAEINAKVAQAKAQLGQAKRDLSREQALLEKNASTKEMVLNLTDRVTMLEAMVKEAEVMLGYTEIVAPFDGAIAQKYSDEGSLAAPGMPLLDLVGQEHFEIEVAVPESMIGELAIGSVSDVSIPASGVSFEAELSEVSSSLDGHTRTVAARFVAPEGVVLRAGQFARVALSRGTREALVVPEGAVRKDGQLERVFVVENGKAQLRLVKRGAVSGERVEILSGVDAGEQVVVSSDSKVQDGQPVAAR